MSAVLLMSVAGLACWPVCFYWMYRISSRQDALLGELREQARRIEKLSKDEHDLIRDVHPEVHEIKKNVDKVAAATGAR